MSTDRLVAEAVAAGSFVAPKRYVSALLAVARSARRKEYLVIHVASGTFFRTDRLGAIAARALVDGRSDTEAIDRVEAIEPGAGERSRLLIDIFDSWGAMTPVPPRFDSARFRLRHTVAIVIGMGLSVFGQGVHVAPAGMLAWMFRIWPWTPIARHVWRCNQLRIVLTLCASGYAGRAQQWLLNVGRRSAVEPSRSYLFNYVSVAIPGRRRDHVVDRLFDRDSLTEIASRLQAEGPVVGVFLHGPLCVAVPNALRNRGHEVVRVVAPRTHGINVSAGSGRLGDYFGETPEMAVEESPNASGALLRHLKAGRSVYVALDKIVEGKAESKVAKIEMLGRSLARNDGPAWLAVHSGRPVVLWTTHNSPKGVVITASPLVYPDPSQPVEQRVAALSEQLYAYADAAIHERPESWVCWSYLGLLEGSPSVRVLAKVPASKDRAPHKYLRSVLVVARSARRGEYVVVHLASGSFFRTDRLGALMMRALIAGRSGAEAIELVQRTEARAGEGARQLIAQLDSQHALTLDRPVANIRRRLRRLVASGVGLALRAMAPLVRLTPTRLLAWAFKTWPSTPVARYVWSSSRSTVFSGLRASGYAGQSQAWLREVGRQCASEASRNYLFNYVSVAIPAQRLESLVGRLFDRDSLEKLALGLETDGPVIGVFLHNPLCVAIPNALRTRGQEVVRVIVARTHGINVRKESGPLRDFFGEARDMAVEEGDPNASGALLRHLKAGRSVYLALDKLPGESKTAKVDILGHCMDRNDGPAWLAVHSGRPLALWTTHNSPTGVVITGSQLLFPDLALPVKSRVAALSEQLYSHAEAAIREHPEAWTLWTHPGFLGANLAEGDGDRTVAQAAAVVVGR